jgi:hypothetical protein
MSGQHTPIPMSSDKGEKYATLAARIRVGKTSQEDAARAILDLVSDNERLAVLLGERKAKAATADDLLEALQTVPGDSAHITEWDAWREIARAAVLKAEGKQ